MQLTHRKLILGGQKSGKSRTAESRANDWLAQTGHCAVLLATAQSGDAAMAARIASIASVATVCVSVIS